MSTNTNVRVVSYNLLSSKLARPSHFTHADPDHLEPEYRLPRILTKLDEAMNRDFSEDENLTAPPPTVFALQEVCYPFASALHAFFAKKGYHFVTGLYGKPFNGYMGVGLAYPIEHFETVNVDICRLRDERPGGWPREKIDEQEDSSTKRFGQLIKRFTLKTIQAVVNGHLIQRLGYSSEKPVDPWHMSENRFNVLLTVALRSRAEGSKTFSVSNYHMPCAFYAPAVMNIHSEMVAKRVQDLAKETLKSIEKSNGSHEMIPYILAGDFNIMPESSHYKLLTTGDLDKVDPTYPPPKYKHAWKIESLPMDSAYALSDSEPDFTNFAHIRDQPEPFIGTLDYIFLSQKDQSCSAVDGLKSGSCWKVRRVQKLPSREDSGGPFPNENEPSDHYLIAADLELVSL